MPEKKPKRAGVRQAVYLTLSLAVTFAVFSFLFSRVSLDDVVKIIKEVDLKWVGVFLLLSILMSVARTWRYQVALGVSGFHPKNVPLFLVVLVRNLFSDLLPARLGTLVYIYIVNTRLAIPMAAATSSFALAFLFDMIALAPLLGMAVLLAAPAEAISKEMLVWICIGWFALVGVILYSLVPLARWGASLIGKFNPLKALAELVRDTGLELDKARKEKVYGKLLMLSLVVRGLKYSAMYFLLVAMLVPMGYTVGNLRPPDVFLGLCGAELAASLPISGIAGFGAYEGAWALVFRLLGYDPAIADLTAVSHHLLTQLWGYGLGGLAMLLLLLPVFKKGR